MSDALTPLSEASVDALETPAEARDDAESPRFPPPPRQRYRPSEAWALRWLGPARS